MINPIEYADLKRIVKKLRCNGMTEADVILEVAEILKFGLREDGDEEEF